MDKIPSLTGMIDLKRKLTPCGALWRGNLAKANTMLNSNKINKENKGCLII